MTRFLSKTQFVILAVLLVSSALLAQTYVRESSVGTPDSPRMYSAIDDDGVPMQEWVGMEFVILPKPKHLQRYGYSTLRRPNGGFIIPTYGECAGQVGTVVDVQNDGRTDCKVTLRMDDGREYTAVSATGLFPEIALASDFEHARTEWEGQTVWFYSSPVYIYDDDTGQLWSIQTGRYEPVVVKEVVAGWNHNRPVRLIVETEDGREAYVDVQVSSTNTYEYYYGRNRYDVFFVMEDPYAH